MYILIVAWFVVSQKFLVLLLCPPLPPTLKVLFSNILVFRLFFLLTPSCMPALLPPSLVFQLFFHPSCIPAVLLPPTCMPAVPPPPSCMPAVLSPPSCMPGCQLFFHLPVRLCASCSPPPSCMPAVLPPLSLLPHSCQLFFHLPLCSLIHASSSTSFLHTICDLVCFILPLSFNSFST